MTKIYLASPAEPSGASWLINCFLELGVKVSHKPVVDTVWRLSAAAPQPDAMWQRTADGSYCLHPRAGELKKFLPILSRVEIFRFRDDVQVEYVQELPEPRHRDERVLFFVRDPRDSLYSAYCRQQPVMDYKTFLDCPDPDTLLDRPSHWRLYVNSWLALARDGWFTFEDYKRDAAALLRKVLEHARVRCTAEEIERAALESSFDKARAAEERYRASHAEDTELINRAGRVGGWIQQSDSRDGSAVIESRVGDVMQKLGYELSRDVDAASEDSSIEKGLAFSRAVDEDFLRRTNLPNHRIRRLLENLELTAHERRWDSETRLKELRRHFVDGSEHQFSQMRDLLLRRRRTDRAAEDAPG